MSNLYYNILYLEYILHISYIARHLKNVISMPGDCAEMQNLLMVVIIYAFWLINPR